MTEDVLDEMMREWENETKYSVPLFVFDENYRGDNLYPYEHLDAAIFLYWSYSRKLLDNGLESSIHSYLGEIGKLDHKKLILLLKKTVPEGQVFSDHFRAEIREFVVDYVSNPASKFNYLEDLRRLYPDARSFSEIPNRQEEYNVIFSLLDQRYAER